MVVFSHMWKKVDSMIQEIRDLEKLKRSRSLQSRPRDFSGDGVKAVVYPDSIAEVVIEKISDVDTWLLLRVR